MTKGEKDYSQSEQGGVSQPGQENSQQRNCMSVAQTYWVIDLLSQNKWNGTRVFWFLIPKSLVSLGVSVSTCIQYYFKGFSLKTVSTPNQIAGWERETFCLLITLPTTCLRGASFPKDPGHLTVLSTAAVSSLPISSQCTAPMALWEPTCVVCFVTLEQHRPRFKSCLHWLLVSHFSAPQFSWSGNRPSLNGCD